MLSRESDFLHQVIRQQIDKRAVSIGIKLRHVVELVLVKDLGGLVGVDVGGVGADVGEFEVECFFWYLVSKINEGRGKGEKRKGGSRKTYSHSSPSVCNHTHPRHSAGPS